MRRTSKAPSAASAPAAGSTTFATPRRHDLLGLVCLCVGFAALLASAPSAVAAASLPGQGFLPDDRGWEMVSPVDKNGGEVRHDAAMVRVAEDGTAASFVSMANFADSVGAGLVIPYMSVRDSNGWSTHGLAPPQDSASFYLQTTGTNFITYVGDLSPDANIGIFRSASSLPGTSAAVFDVPNLYLRTDLRTPGAGSYQLLTSCPEAVCASPLAGPVSSDSLPVLAGTSTDYSTILFESRFKLTADAPSSFSSPKAYKSTNGNLEWIGQIPPSDATACGPDPFPACVSAPAERSVAGRGAGVSSPPTFNEHTISDDGSRVNITVPVSDESQMGDLYQRDDQGTADPADDTTVHLNASERTEPDVVEPASYEDAANDGSRVFFTTPQALTDDTPIGTEDKLYMYDASKPAGDPENLTYLSKDKEPEDGIGGGTYGILAVSDDGDTVYFGNSGQLVEDGPSVGGEPAIYRWKEGAVEYLGHLVGLEDIGESTIHNWGFDPARTATTTPDGKAFLIGSRTDPGSGAPNGACADTPVLGCRQFYLYTEASGELTCVTCVPAPGEPTSNAEIQAKSGPFEGGNLVSTWHRSRALSDDGRFAFFDTADPLAPDGADTNGVRDVYRYDAESGEVALLSSGTSPNDSRFMEATPDGSDAFLITTAPLVGQDDDESYDLYDARVGGGLASQNPPSAGALCAGDSCQGAQRSTAPPPPAAASRFEGPANPTARRRHCPKGKRRVKTRGGKNRCVNRKRAEKPRGDNR